MSKTTRRPLIRRVKIVRPGERPARTISWWDVRLSVTLNGATFKITSPILGTSDKTKASRTAREQAASRWPAASIRVASASRRVA